MKIKTSLKFKRNPHWGIITIILLRRIASNKIIKKATKCPNWYRSKKKLREALERRKEA
jgi:hypothetical protein